jgi:hypothetical protein
LAFAQSLVTNYSADIQEDDTQQTTETQNDNVIYYEFNQSESEKQEGDTMKNTYSENNDTNAFNNFDTLNDIFSKFDKVEITTEQKISSEDLEFCQEQETIYKKLVEVHNNFIDQLQEVTELNKWHSEKFACKINDYTYKQETAYSYSLAGREISETINKMKNKFISSVCYYFMKKYSVTINHEKIQKKFDLNVTYENIIDCIYMDLDGYNFTEKAIQELKEKSRNAVRNSDKITIKNTKLIIDGHFSYHDSIWKEYRLNGGFCEIFKGLQHFEDGSTAGNDELVGKYVGYQNERKAENYERYEPMTLSKVKSIKFLKNGKLEIEFFSNRFAAKFASEYCGYQKQAV